MLNQTFPSSCPTVCFNGLSLLVSIRETRKNRNNQQNTVNPACAVECEAYSARIYSGCQKNVPVFERFFSTTVHSFMPHLRNSEHYYEKRYK